MVETIMLDTFKSLIGLVKYRRTHIDSTFFRFHYTFTVIMLLAFCVVISTTQFVGEPIACVPSDSTVPQKMINFYCYVHTTYTIPESQFVNLPASSINAQPGVSVEIGTHKYHNYYQWVCFVLIGQAIMFYAPHWLWKVCESGKMKALVMDLDVAFLEEEEKKKKKNKLVSYLICNIGCNDWYAARYVACEILAFLNVILQILFTDWFLGGTFLSFGFDIFKHSQQLDGGINPMIKMFPRMTKCIFKKFGFAGTVVDVDALCLLTINVINEKIYIILWFWFSFLLIISIIMLLLRFFSIVSPGSFRLYLFKKRLNLPLNDKFSYTFLGKNIDAVLFREILEECNDKTKKCRKFNSIDANEHKDFIR